MALADSNVEPTKRAIPDPTIDPSNATNADEASSGKKT